MKKNDCKAPVVANKTTGAADYKWQLTLTHKTRKYQEELEYGEFVEERILDAMEYCAKFQAGEQLMMLRRSLATLPNLVGLTNEDCSELWPFYCAVANRWCKNPAVFDTVPRAIDCLKQAWAEVCPGDYKKPRYVSKRIKDAYPIGKRARYCFQKAKYVYPSSFEEALEILFYII